MFESGVILRAVLRANRTAIALDVSRALLCTIQRDTAAASISRPALSSISDLALLAIQAPVLSDDEILDKEKFLRDIMKPGREVDLIRFLTEADFKADNIECFCGLRLHQALNERRRPSDRRQ